MPDRRAALLRLSAALALPLLPPRAFSAQSQPQSQSPRLVVDFMISSGALRSAWVKLVQAFQAQNPGLQIIANEFSQEEYKHNFTTRLQQERVDLAFWFAGARLKEAARQGLLRPIDEADLLQRMGMRFTSATLDALEDKGRLYGAPISYYQWGFFYSRSLFAQLGIAAPKDWDAFEQACARLRGAGVTPTAVGAQNGWPAAAWFDYFNLRCNGRAIHQRLLAGELSFQDPRIRAALQPWRDMLARGDFLAETMTEDWDAVLPYLYRKSVGMVLMGAFAASKFPPQIAPDIGFFPFPQIKPQVARAEEAPLDVVVLPAKGENPAAASRFLRFLAEHPALNTFNQEVSLLSPRVDAPPETDALRRAGRTLLGQASGLTFFFDRDARGDLVAPAFAAISAFLRPPHDLDRMLAAMETARNVTPAGA
ncbi:ABC transporter substrate-binding protein [Niveibacterium umoris]|nr:extracellular solute-binding protein [Niveibacterium umoris]